jgi:hypothetical protein
MSPARRPLLADPRLNELAGTITAAAEQMLALLAGKEQQIAELARQPVPRSGEGPIRYLGIGEVAKELGVNPQTVSVWLIDYDNCPQPDAEIGPGRHGVPERGWLPGRVAEWRHWMEHGRPGRGAPGRPRPDRRKEVVA